MPSARSRRTASRSMASFGLPIRRPSSRALRKPARTLSLINDRSSSAIALTITSTAFPKAPSGIDLLAEADEFDLETCHLVEHLEEVCNWPGQPVTGPNQQDIELALAGVHHQPVQAKPGGSGAGNLVFIDLDNLKLSPGWPVA